MDGQTVEQVQGTPVKGGTDEHGAPEQRVSQIATLLKSIDDAAAEVGRSSSPPPKAHQNALVQARLGLASSLFSGLRAKHSPTAEHCLRVAIGSSSFAMAMGLSSEARDPIEVAAILHDIGKIGIPDKILLKPGELTPDEAAIMECHPLIGIEILQNCCASQSVLDIVRLAPSWYDGGRTGYTAVGDEIPLGARIVAIVDAFDSMTTDQVYRPARSRERATAELFEVAGRQFDPELVNAFAELQRGGGADHQAQVAASWLKGLASKNDNRHWRLGPSTENPASVTVSKPGSSGYAIFEERLLDNMYDGVVFVDSQLQIFRWNRGTERLAGISGAAANRRIWTPTLLNMRDVKGSRLSDEQCMVAQAIKTGSQSRDRVTIVGSSDKEVHVGLHVVPVVGGDGVNRGAIILLRDMSSEASLEERCQDLHVQATKDPMTGTANRAEFDRLHTEFVKAHLQREVPCSLIITDLDRFKRINDNFGHQAGDDAIKSLASLMMSRCRPGDLVARYGGEEFVMICAACNNATAAERAELLRRELADMPQPKLGNKRITASFGVTELQPGDTAETMLRRADRALLQAKDMGRNMVVQLGSGMVAEKHRRSWWPFAGSRPNALIEKHLITPVPFEVAVEKLRGFVSDHSAHIESVGEDHMNVRIEGHRPMKSRRKTDRPITFSLEMRFSETHVERTNSQGLAAGKYAETNIEVVIRPKRSRDRRRDHSSDSARDVLTSLKSYLMAHEGSPAVDKAVDKSAEADGSAASDDATE